MSDNSRQHIRTTHSAEHSAGKHRHRVHEHHHKHKKSAEERMLNRKVNWRKIKKFVAKVLFVLMCIAAVAVCIYGLYLLLFVQSEPIKELADPTE